MDALDAIFEPAYLKRMREKIEALAAEFEGEARPLMDEEDSTATLYISEAGADKLLRVCEAAPIPAYRRPSLFTSKADRNELFDLLSLRLRRAIGCGKSARDYGNIHEALLIFCFEEELDQALHRLGVGEDTSSSLGELLI